MKLGGKYKDSFFVALQMGNNFLPKGGLMVDIGTEAARSRHYQTAHLAGLYDQTASGQLRLRLPVCLLDLFK